MYQSKQQPQHELVSDAAQIVTQTLDGVGGLAGLHCLGVVRNEEGLLRLDDHDTFLALDTDLVVRDFTLGVERRYLLAVESRLVRLESNVFLATDVEATGLNGFQRVTRSGLKGVHDSLDFFGGDLLPSAVHLPAPCDIRSAMSSGFGRGHTEKPGEAAHTLLPWSSKMAALSTWPEPTRLGSVSQAVLS